MIFPVLKIKKAGKHCQLCKALKSRVYLGRVGRVFVLENYEWKENAGKVERLYKEVINDYKKR
jgi:hypothetical protein